MKPSSADCLSVTTTHRRSSVTHRRPSIGFWLICCATVASGVIARAAEDDHTPPPKSVTYLAPPPDAVDSIYVSRSNGAVFSVIREYSPDRFKVDSVGNKIPQPPERVFVSGDGASFRHSVFLRETDTRIEENLYGDQRTLIAGRKTYIDPQSRQVLHAEHAATNGAAPWMTICEWVGDRIKIVLRHPGQNEERSEDIATPDGGFIPDDWNYVFQHYERWGLPTSCRRSFRPLSVENRRFIQVNVIRTPDAPILIAGRNADVEILCRAFDCKIVTIDDAIIVSRKRLFFRPSDGRLVRIEDHPATGFLPDGESRLTTDLWLDDPRAVPAPEPIAIKARQFEPIHWPITRQRSYQYIVYAKDRQFGTVTFTVTDAEADTLIIQFEVELKTGAGERSETGRIFVGSDGYASSLTSDGTIASQTDYRYQYRASASADGRIETSTARFPGSATGDASNSASPAKRARTQIVRLDPGLFLIDYNNVALMTLLAHRISNSTVESPDAGKPAGGWSGDAGVYQTRNQRVSRFAYSVIELPRRDSFVRRKIRGETGDASSEIIIRNDGVIERWTLSDKTGNDLTYQLASEPQQETAGDDAVRDRLLKFSRFVRPDVSR